MWARRISFFIINFFHVWLHMPPTRSRIITLPRSWNALIVISLICLQSDVCRTISESNGDRYGVNRTSRIFPNLIAHNENFWHNFFLKCLFFSKVTLKSIILKIFKHNLCDPSSDTIQFQVVKTWNKRERNAPLELRLSKKNNSCACNECIRVIFFACKNVGACEISEASCTHKSKKHAGEKRSFAFSTQSCHPRWLAACKLFSFLL